jgi:protocatechuate 3,4-dioxygenase beta subunit
MKELDTSEPDPDPSRREVVFWIGSLAAATVFGCGNGADSASVSPTNPSSTPTGTCVVRPQQTEGPYFVDERLNRSDIRTDPADGSTRPGVPLRLAFRVSRAAAGSSCVPLPGVVVDVWHCDALGVYSDVQDMGFGTLGRKFLRGYQATDAAGLATFTTIYPGWYSGRAVHAHFKLRSPAGAASGFEFTSQVYFDEALTDVVHAQAPYSAKGRRNTLNGSDGIFRSGGSQLLLPAVAESAGYGATFDIALQI